MKIILTISMLLIGVICLYVAVYYAVKDLFGKDEL